MVDIEMNGLDPNNLVAGAARRVACNISPGLVCLGASGAIEPALADEWDVRDAGRTYVFHLVEARFHTLRPVTAQAIVENFQRICGPDSPSFQQLDYQVIRAVSAVNERTVRFDLHEQFAPFLGLLANSTGITDVSALGHRDPRIHPVGAGPYELAAWVPGDRLELRAFADYHRSGFPKVAEVIWRFRPDDAARINALLEEDAVIAWAPPLAALPELRRRGFAVDVARGHGPTHLAFNCATVPFSDRRVRLAIAHAVHRERLVRELFDGFGTPATTPFPPSSPWHAELAGHQHDPERARALLVEAGFGGRLQLDLPVNGPAGARVGRVLAEDLAVIGIDLRVVPYPNPTWWPGIYTTGQWKIILQTWTPMPDPDQVMGRRYHSLGIFNAGRYSSAAMDDLLERGRRVIQQRERVEVYRAAQALAIEDAPTVYLFHEPAITTWTSSVQGFQPRSNWEICLESVAVAPRV